MQTTAIVNGLAHDDCEPEQAQASGARPTCAACPNPIEVIPGHRRRLYCSDTCKQRAYLERETQKSKATRLAQLRASYPDFSEATLEMLDSFLAVGNEEMVERLAATITGEVEARQRGLENVQARFNEYVRMTNARLSELSGELARRRQKQAGKGEK